MAALWRRTENGTHLYFDFVSVFELEADTVKRGPFTLRNDLVTSIAHLYKRKKLLDMGSVFFCFDAKLDRWGILTQLGC